MEHPRDIELIELAAGHLSPDDAARIDAHVRSCAACAERLATVSATWRELGSWTTPEQAGDVTAGVLAQIDAESQPVRTIGRLPWRAARIAAVLALAGGIGHLAGRMTWTTAPLAELSAAGQEPEQAAEALYLDALGEGMGVSLVRTLEEADAEQTESAL